MNRTTIHALAAVMLLAAAGAARAAGPVDDALAAFRAGEYEKAVTIASAVPEADPARVKALYVVGEAELARKRWDDAAKAFEAVLASKKDSVPALTGLGRAQAGRGERDASEKTLRRACELDAKDPLPRRALGETLLAADRTDDALRELEAAWKLDGKDPLTARALVEALLRKGSVDAASKTANAFAATAPKSATAWFLKGLVLDRKGEADDAIDAYEKAVAADDRFLDAHRNLAVLLTTSNSLYADPSKVERACAHAQKYVDLGGEDARLKELLDQIRGFLEQMKEGGGGGR
jgi:tetratricopeptide (TPR) repeat protein